jgi:Protein of unknown function (DUF2950)
LRWVPPPGALGAAIGAIAIGTAATSTSTTTTISIGTTILIGISVAKEEVNGSTMRSTGGMRLMGIGRRRISLGVQLAARVAGRRVLGPELALVVAPELALVVAPELVRAAAELEHGRVAVELELAQGVAELELVPVAVKLELGQVVVELELGQVVAVAPRIKSVTAAPHHGLVPRLAGEDLVAVAETTHEPAATEAGAAWAAAAATAAAAIVVAVAAAQASVAVVAEDAAAEGEEAAGVAVADDADKRMLDGEKTMKTKRNTMTFSKMIVPGAAMLITSFLAAAAVAAPEKKEAAAKQEDAQTTVQPGQKQFDTPKQAADALIQVAANFDVAAAKEILGPDGDDLISSEDPVMDKNRATEFANKAKEKTSVDIDKQNPNHAILMVGKDDFPLPIPIVKQKGKWFFDTKVGREEILNRRVGANELNAIAICRGIVEAQHEYAQEKHDDSKVNQYAQHVLSTPGKHDGLAWKNPDGTWGGPVGEEVAKALEEGYSEKRGQPYHGYYFKVLKGQGPDAPMGEMDFMVGPDGVVYEKDLGPDTLKTFQSMDRYNPDKTWEVTQDDVEEDSSE